MSEVIDRPDGTKINRGRACSPPLIAFLVALAVVALHSSSNVCTNSINIVGGDTIVTMYIEPISSKVVLGTLKVSTVIPYLL